MTSVRPRVTFSVLNLRLGGQVSSVTSVMSLLRERGLEARFLGAGGAGDPTKAALAELGARGAPLRAATAIRTLRALPSGPDDVVHLVLPTPAFAPFARLAPTSPARLVLQYEGPPTALDAEHLSALREDVRLVAPRLLLNHGAWARLAARARGTHLATTPGLAAWLRARGFAHVVEIANVARLGDRDAAPLPPGLVRDGERVVAYVGHAHPAKGVDDLVEAFARAAPRRPELVLVLALSPDGNGGRVAARVRALPAAVAARVRLAGVVPVGSLLARLDALVLPYRTLVSTTLYPSLLLEADEARCPVVISDVPQLRPALRPTSAGLFRFPARDAGALAETLAALPPRGEGARVLALPAVAARVDALCELYRRLAGGEAAAA